MADIPRIDFPVTCPKCAAASGFPYKATTIRDSLDLELSMRCHGCRHEWVAWFEGVQHSPKKPSPHHAAH